MNGLTILGGCSVFALYSTVAKMDAWVRQGEVWRADIEAQLGDITSQNK